MRIHDVNPFKHIRRELLKKQWKKNKTDSIYSSLSIRFYLFLTRLHKEWNFILPFFFPKHETTWDSWRKVFSAFFVFFSFFLNSTSLKASFLLTILPRFRFFEFHFASESRKISRRGENILLSGFKKIYVHMYLRAKQLRLMIV